MRHISIDATTLLHGPEVRLRSVVKSARNLPGIKTMTANLLNVLDLLSYKVVLMTESAVRRVEELWGNTDGGNNASV